MTYGMKYCLEAGCEVYSCDHAKCNGDTPQEHQGMIYCFEEKEYVYGCDHYKCNEHKEEKR